jgi:hypothetical protein
MDKPHQVNQLEEGVTPLSNGCGICTNADIAVSKVWRIQKDVGIGLIVEPILNKFRKTDQPNIRGNSIGRER